MMTIKEKETISYLMIMINLSKLIKKQGTIDATYENP